MTPRPPTAAGIDLRIDPGLRPEALRPLFARFGRLHLPGVLAGDGAGRLHAGLAAGAPWRKAFLHGGAHYEPTLAEYEAISDGQRQALDQAIWREARDGFAYRFDSWKVSDDVEAGRRTGAAAEAAYDFLNGDAFLNFIRILTNEPRAAYCDAQATRYGPGDFLTRHSDAQPGKHRLFAYVLNLTPGWRADWGGVLAFPDEDGHLAEGYSPAFNALNLFRVPQDHAVTAVAPFAGGERLSITGWVRARG